MKSSRIYQLAGWLVFLIAFLVYFSTAEPTGSLWDCGEFILGAYKLQVVHPPGAPVFLLIGRMFTWVADILSDNPEHIAFSVNLMSGICSAMAAAFIAWVTMMLGRLTLVARTEATTTAQDIALAGAGVAAGLATAFSTSVWFSAVEGEVYAMSTFFTTMTLWGMVKWYTLPDEPKTDRWLMFTVFSAGLSIGVHLLSLLTFPALALFYYFKKYKEHTVLGTLLAAGGGVLALVVVQKLIITGIPSLWSTMELMMVNGLGLPVHSGLIPTLLIIGAIIYFGLKQAHQRNNSVLQNIVLGFALVVVAFSSMGTVVVRANAKPPINMNAPSDAMRLLPYLNREQYGERPLVYGPSFNSRRDEVITEDRYGLVGDRYEIVDQKVDVSYPAREKMLFPRMSDNTQQRARLYKQWMGLSPDQPLPAGRPNMVDNIGFLVRYQLGWMYWRYFMWNFSGRQNGEQGYYDWDETAGNWITGIGPLDAMRLGNQSELPEVQKNNPARNTYYLIPFILGLVGMFFHYSRRPKDFTTLLALFVITGIGIIIYSNQPPNEPRERDYVLVGSFFTYCIWIGMAVLALFRLLQDKLSNQGVASAAIASAVVLIAPVLMAVENFDDHDRSEHYAARDYANNFLESVDENAIIFTYGDNDTYPLWYAQEVEGIRTDVRVVNLSLIAVDWYIDLLRRKVNDSPPIKMTIPQEQYRGNLRNQVLFNPNNRDRQGPMALQDFVRYIGEDHPLPLQGGQTLEAQYPTTDVYIPVDRQRAIAAGILSPTDSVVVDRIPVRVNDRSLIKDDIAILDIIASNFYERPVYFAVTCQESKLFGMDDFMRLEGLALRVSATRGKTDGPYMPDKGSVDTDKVYDRVMNKFRWGNFDQVDTYVDRSYTPSVQSTQLVVRRTALALLDKGEREKAIDLTDQYFSAFPHMNFPYSYQTWFMITVYLEARAFEKAKPHLEILANELVDHMDYYLSLDDATLSDYETEFRVTYQSMNSILMAIQRENDPDFLSRMQALFAPYLEESAPATEMPLPPGGN